MKTFNDWWATLTTREQARMVKGDLSEAWETAAKIEREACAKESELLLRLVSAVTASEFGGISCFDIDGHGNWFDVRDALLCSNAEVSGVPPQD